jgi:hypothetical protein
MNEFEMLARQGYPADALMRLAGGDTAEDIRMEEEREMLESTNGFRELHNLSLWLMKAFTLFGLERRPDIHIKRDAGYDTCTLWIDEDVTVEFSDRQYLCVLWGVHPGRWYLDNGDPGYPDEPYERKDYATNSVAHAAIKAVSWIILDKMDRVEECITEDYAEVMADAKWEERDE